MAKDGWKKRLVLAIRDQVARGRTLREISLTAGLGPNFAQQLVSSDKVPSVDALVALCDSLNINICHLFSPVAEPQTEVITALAERLRPDDFRVVLDFARFLSQKNTGSVPE